MARLATRQDADALDVVQEAMTRLVTHYGDAPESDWRPLFFKILGNCLNDWHRENSKRKRWFMLDRFRIQESDGVDSADLVECAEDDSTSPMTNLARQRQQQDMMHALESLPFQQQQCFLLRCWEGMSVTETAEAMGISVGSVKTHLYRAKQKLHLIVEEHDVQSKVG